MPDVVEAAGNIRIERPFTRTGGSQQSVKGDDRVHRAPSGPEPIAVRLETCLPFGFQRHFDEHLQGPVADRWNPQGPPPAIRFRDIHPADWLGMVVLEVQIVGQPHPAFRRPAHHAVNAGRIAACVLLGDPASRFADVERTRSFCRFFTCRPFPADAAR